MTTRAKAPSRAAGPAPGGEVPSSPWPPAMDGRKMTALLMPAKATAKPKAKAEPRPVAPEPTA